MKAPSEAAAEVVLLTLCKSLDTRGALTTLRHEFT
jgi:hypothetical protein